MRFESRIEQYAPPGGIPSSGSAILLDLGAHVVDQALLLFGPVVSPTPSWTIRASFRSLVSAPRALTALAATNGERRRSATAPSVSAVPHVPDPAANGCQPRSIAAIVKLS
jgi:hypothetical protein